MLGTLDTGDYRRVVVHRDGVWYGRNPDVTIAEAIPRSLRRLVAEGRPGVQRSRQNGQPTVVVAVPLSPSAAFYEIGSLSVLERTLDVLALSLTAVAVMVAAGGAGLGWYSARRVLRPLGYVADAAERIAAGGYGTRLDPTTEPDLGRLTASFNHMVDELSARLERDRRFAADVSHELRFPLQTLSAAASVLTRRRFIQILDNLLDNAVQCAGGPTAVRVGGDPGLCVVEVDDQGPGVHPADRTTIFDRFVDARYRRRHACPWVVAVLRRAAMFVTTDGTVDPC